MRVLFIGGTGNISTSVSRLAVAEGIDLTLLNRGQTHTRISGAQAINADIYQPDAVREALKGRTFDSVVNWIAFHPDDIERDLSLFKDIAGQYIFISSASAYQKPPTQAVITESTPLSNPYMQYSRNKIACEERLMQAYRETRFPITIVRPSHTYAQQIPAALTPTSYFAADRLLRGRTIIEHGDGSSLWTLTHAEDFAKGFVGLLGNPQAIGHAVHITSDEVLAWSQIHRILAETLGVPASVIHIPSDFIMQHDADIGQTLLGDKTWCAQFDNTKIKTLVPDYKATIPFYKGIEMALAWFDAHPEQKQVDEAAHTRVDKLISLYGKRN
ncbi:MAG: SDR family oxidoreductase [Chloroflexota bacterium]